jgi:quercetin dioxygenase-like cupin family protein
MPPDTNLRWTNLIDVRAGVLGVALVKRGYVAPLHHHPVSETYYVLCGVATMWHEGRVRTIVAPAVVTIAESASHALTPVSAYVLLAYWFPRGPFASIPYTWLDETCAGGGQGWTARARL